ncbi:hypothetical protein ACIOHS_00730 [Streptomyces sp. NPDC088253]|uniref:hypothetical protein n=1 Tax=Streptomyces sp. NPDC088253 TaxID=3365846 RepID=UPI003817BD4E
MAPAAVMLGFFTIMVDAMIVNVALPSIGRGFDSGMTGLQWVVDGYALIALWGVSGSVGSAAGPVAGDLLTVIDWRMVFFANLPVGAVALALLKRAQPSPRQSEHRLLRDDLPAGAVRPAGARAERARQLGGALAVPAFGALVANQAGFVDGLHTSLVIAAATVGVTVLATLSLRPAPRT